MRTAGVIFLFTCLMITSCTAVRRTAVAEKKFAPEQLKKDYTIFRGALEESHPGLYWFTPKDSMDKKFDEGYASLNDSLTERQFRMTLLKVITAIRCGHTSVNYSKKYLRYLDTASLELFPLAFKILKKDTLSVTANLNKHDSLLRRGTIVTSINNRSSSFYIDTLMEYVTSDGYSMTGKYQSLSTFGSFGALYKNLFGLTDSLQIKYLNNQGEEKKTVIPVFTSEKDTTGKTDSLKAEKFSSRGKKKEDTFDPRDLQVDTTLKSAYMLLNTFARGNHLKKFFRNSFKSIDEMGLKHLVIDVRSNGGGDAGLSTLLTQYLSDHSFIIADSLYAIKRSSRYRKYIRQQRLYWLMATIITRKRPDGHFHFGYFERHRFKPRKKHHFNGNVYILTGGNSFSATTLFAQELKGQPNVQIIGEETGGGSYGNNAWIIPVLKLPATQLRVSIPKFRFVMRKEFVKEGRGVIPDVFAAPHAEDIRKGADVKIDAVRNLIMQANSIKTPS